jgi:hypothetical protein
VYPSLLLDPEYMFKTLRKDSAGRRWARKMLFLRTSDSYNPSLFLEITVSLYKRFNSTTCNKVKKSTRARAHLSRHCHWHESVSPIAQSQIAMAAVSPTEQDSTRLHAVLCFDAAHACRIPESKSLQNIRNNKNASRVQGTGSGGLTAFPGIQTQLDLQLQVTRVWVKGGRRHRQHPNGPACCSPRSRASRRASRRQSSCVREAFNTQKRYWN